MTVGRAVPPDGLVVGLVILPLPAAGRSACEWPVVANAFLIHMFRVDLTGALLARPGTNG
jgi:hypothetical protein